MAGQRYKAVLAVIGDGRSITEVAASWGISRQTLHTWLARWDASGLEGLVDRSHRPLSCPHQIDPVTRSASAANQVRGQILPGHANGPRSSASRGKGLTACMRTGTI